MAEFNNERVVVIVPRSNTKGFVIVKKEEVGAVVIIKIF